MAMSVDLSSITGTFLTECEDNGLDDVEVIQAPAIYGRERETALLLQTYERVVQTGQSQTVLVHGLSGHGKTALINKFRDTVCASEALFCGAKYFQNSGFQEPHSAIVAAFSDLCDLVIQSTTFTEERRQQIRKDLGPEGGILKKVISNIAPFLQGSSHDDLEEELQSEAVMTLFRVACKNFLRVMASDNKPVVLFLDDIQWMDEGSRKMIEMYVSDSELENVMIILAYRDEEAACVKSMLANVNMEAFVDVPVMKLNKEGVADMVARIMHHPQLCSPDKRENTHDLVELIYQRTNGNPFHVIQFVDTIQLERLLTFDVQSKAWSYNVQVIQREVMVATSVADLLLRKIKLLPKGEQETLKVASLLGYDFNESVLFEIVREERRSQESDESVAISTRSLTLGKAHELGLVERVGEFSNFPHDKIQSAFSSMISNEEEMLLQHTIGETYLSLKDDDSAYLAALHLNQTIHLIQSREEQVRLVRINLQASSFAADRSAFDAAAGLLRQSLRILDMEEQDKWSQHFDLAFEITENLARMELIIGNLERSRELTQEALSRATSLDMKINSLLNAVECQPTVGALVQTAIGALSTLGIKFPRKVRTHHVIRKFFSVRRSLRDKTDEEILQLPLMEDKAKKTASRILINLCLHACLLDEELTGIYAALTAFEMTLSFGLPPHGPTYIIIFGSAEFTAGNYKQAYRFACLGKTLLDQMQSKTAECSSYFLWVGLAHWTEPLAGLREPIAKGIESGFQTGDIIFTSIAMLSLFGLNFDIGCNLQDLRDLMRQYYNRLRDFSQEEAMLFWVQPFFQAVLNLQSESYDEWSDLTTLSGEIMNEEAFFSKTADVKNDMVEIFALTLKSMLAYNFGFVDLSVDAYKKMANVNSQFFSSGAGRGWYLHGSLTYYEYYRRTGKWKHYRKARKWQRKLEQSQARGSPNVGYVSILQAEEKSFQKRLKVDDLIAAYDAAIADMADETWVQFEGLANERAGFVLVERGMPAEGKKYFDRALALYGHDWGAIAKYDWLQEQISDLQLPHDSHGSLPSSPPDIGDILVLESTNSPSS